MIYGRRSKSTERERSFGKKIGENLDRLDKVLEKLEEKANKCGLSLFGSGLLARMIRSR